MYKHPNPRARALYRAALAFKRSLDVDEWVALAADYGYPRANCFFGGRYPSMQSQGRMRCLTDHGRRRAQ
jgi:hypothetical protein